MNQKTKSWCLIFSCGLILPASIHPAIAKKNNLPIAQANTVNSGLKSSISEAERANSLHRKAEKLLQEEKYAEAEPLLLEALAIRQKLFSPKDRAIAENLKDLGLLYQAQQQFPQALEYLTQASEIEENAIAQNLAIGSERQKFQFFAPFKIDTDPTISLHLQEIPENQVAAELALTNILRRKGRVLDSLRTSWQTLRENLDPKTQQLFTQLANSQSQLANLSLIVTPKDQAEKAKIKAQQRELEAQIARLQAQLSVRSVALTRNQTPVTIAQIQQTLPSNAALVEFVRYQSATSAGNEVNRYGVYVLKPNGTVRGRDLGKAEEIDTLVKQFRKMLSQIPSSDNSGSAKGLEATNKKATILKLKETARRLDELIMEPVRDIVGDATHLLVSPDSTLHYIPFAALVDKQNNYLVEKYLITYLTSGRGLLRIANQPTQTLSSPLLFADSTITTPIGAINTSPLPSAKAEVEAIQEILPIAQVLTGTEASESYLKQQNSPEILHFATYSSLFESSEEVSAILNFPNSRVDSKLPLSNLLLRSVLHLSDQGNEDGALTALEISGLNLSGTKLVVLSASETGLGDLLAGEGIAGFRSAFTLAGTQSQLASLWFIIDATTKDFMIAYHQKIGQKVGRGEALRQVQLEMLKSEDRNHPFYWAAFIPSGSWLPLDSVN